MLRRSWANRWARQDRSARRSGTIVRAFQFVVNGPERTKTRGAADLPQVPSRKSYCALIQSVLPVLQKAPRRRKYSALTQPMSIRHTRPQERRSPQRPVGGQRPSDANRARSAGSGWSLSAQGGWPPLENAPGRQGTSRSLSLCR